MKRRTFGSLKILSLRTIKQSDEHGTISELSKWKRTMSRKQTVRERAKFVSTQISMGL